MAANESADFLVEVGTEELPPGALVDLVEAFATALERALGRERLGHGELRPYASPRRLAVKVTALSRQQSDLEKDLRGPPVRIAYDDAGSPTAAARAFADKCGVSVEALERIETARGAWVSCRLREPGRAAATLLPAIVDEALNALPIPRRMRWGAGEVEFVRPVHWVMMLHGQRVVPGKVLGLEAGRETRGHRFMAPGTRRVAAAADYPRVLAEGGYVLADFAKRRHRVQEEVERVAGEAGGRPCAGEALYEEVTALTEWPVALAGHFDERYLALPREAIVATLTAHQRCFPLEDEAGRLLPRFVMVANLESRDPGKVREGNERVIRPRLADAAFFWEQDKRTPLSAREAALDGVVYQKGLGSLADKAGRVARLAGAMAEACGRDAAVAERAAKLAKCDLLTGMVGEFPELQGVMGRYYAEASGEPGEVAAALGEQYLPRHAGDALPATGAGQVLAVADRLDTLAGAFVLGRRPSGNRDPFGLRRAALGVLRIGIEAGLDLDLPAFVARAVDEQPADNDAAGATRELIYFLLERLRAYYADRGVPVTVYEAVRAREPASLPDFDRRVKAVAQFVELAPAAALAAADKRTANILRQAGGDAKGTLDRSLFREPEEKALYRALQEAKEDARPLLEKRAYAEALSRLAELRGAVDDFFDKVMVMVDDPALRRNRLALLARLRGLFLEVADISRLSIG